MSLQTKLTDLAAALGLSALSSVNKSQQRLLVRHVKARKDSSQNNFVDHCCARTTMSRKQYLNVICLMPTHCYVVAGVQRITDMRRKRWTMKSHMASEESSQTTCRICAILNETWRQKTNRNDCDCTYGKGGRRPNGEVHDYEDLQDANESLQLSKRNNRININVPRHCTPLPQKSCN